MSQKVDRRCVFTCTAGLDEGEREELPESSYVYLYIAMLLEYSLPQFIIDHIADWNRTTL